MTTALFTIRTTGKTMETDYTKMMDGFRKWVSDLVDFINQWNTIPAAFQEQRLTPFVKQLQRDYPQVEYWIQKNTWELLTLFSIFFPDLRARLQDPAQAEIVISKIRSHFRA